MILNFTAWYDSFSSNGTFSFHFGWKHHLISFLPVLTVLWVSPFIFQWLSCWGVTCGDQEITSWSRLQRPSGHLDASFLVMTDTDWIGVWWAWCWVSHQRLVKLTNSYGKRCSKADHFIWIYVLYVTYQRKNIARKPHVAFSWADYSSIIETDRENTGNKPN